MLNLQVFTVAKFYVLTSGQTNINLITFQSFMTFSISFMTPIFLIIGSLNKRKVAVAILTCQRGTRIIGGEVYTAERSPATMSHVVSMVPTRIWYFFYERIKITKCKYVWIFLVKYVVQPLLDIFNKVYFLIFLWHETLVSKLKIILN